MKLSKKLTTLLLALFMLLVVTACNEAATETPEATDEATEVAAAPTEDTNTAEEPNPFDPSSVEFAPFVDNENGISMQYPASWVTHSANGAVTVATNQSIIDAESLSEIGEEAFVVIIPGEIDVFNFQTSQNFSSENILQALETYKVLLEKEGQVYVLVEPPQAFTGTDQNMARMVLRSTEDGEPIITVMAVIMGDSYMALISAASGQERAEELRPLFYHIIESIEVQAPGSFTTEG